MENPRYLLHKSLMREFETRLALRGLLEEQRTIIEEKTKIIKAQEKFIEALKLTVKLKTGYIQRLEQRLGIQWPEQEKWLQQELAEVRKQLYVNPQLIRANLHICELSRQVQDLFKCS